MVQAELDAAALQIDTAIWGAYATLPTSTSTMTKADDGQRYLAAHKLALSPFGQAARLVAKDGGTTYLTHYKKLQRQVSSGHRVC